MVEEHNLIVLGDDDTIVINFNQVLENLKELSLLPTKYEVLPSSLVESAGEKIYEHQGHGPVAQHSHVPEKLRDVVIESEGIVDERYNIGDELRCLIVAQHAYGC